MTIPLAPLHPNLFRLPLSQTHTHIHHICKRFTPFQTYTPYNFSSLTLSNPSLLHPSLLPPSHTLDQHTAFFRFVLIPLPSSQGTYTPPYFLYFPLTFTPDYRRFDLLKPRAIEPYTSFILKQNRAFASAS